MDYSYDYKQARNLSEKEVSSHSKTHSKPIVTKAGIQSLAGAVLLVFLLFLSSNQDNLFMNELIAVSVIWTLVSLVRLQGEPHKNA
jgi:hypothetical protein